MVSARMHVATSPPRHQEFQIGAGRRAIGVPVAELCAFYGCLKTVGDKTIWAWIMFRAAHVLVLPIGFGAYSSQRAIATVHATRRAADPKSNPFWRSAFHKTVLNDPKFLFSEMLTLPSCHRPIVALAHVSPPAMRAPPPAMSPPCRNTRRWSRPLPATASPNFSISFFGFLTAGVPIFRRSLFYARLPTRQQRSPHLSGRCGGFS